MGNEPIEVELFLVYISHATSPKMQALALGLPRIAVLSDCQGDLR